MNSTNFIVFYAIGLAPIFCYLFIYFMRKALDIKLIDLVMIAFASCWPVVREVSLLFIILSIYDRTLFKKTIFKKFEK